MRAKAARIVFALIWIALFYELIFNPALRETLLGFCKAHPQLAPAVLILTQLVLASFALPCSPLSVLAGILWGLYLGIAYSTAATLASSAWTFLLGRRLLKQRIKGREAGWWLAIARLIEQHNWKASMLAHANPIFPGSSLGYVFGASTIEFRAFLLGAILGTLPLQLITVAIGTLAGKSFAGVTAGTAAGMLLLIAALAGYQWLAPRVLARLGRSRGKR